MEEPQNRTPWVAKARLQKFTSEVEAVSGANEAQTQGKMTFGEAASVFLERLRSSELGLKRKAMDHAAIKAGMSRINPHKLGAERANVPERYSPAIFPTGYEGNLALQISSLMHDCRLPLTCITVISGLEKMAL